MAYPIRGLPFDPWIEAFYSWMGISMIRVHHVCSTGQLPSLMFRKSTLRSLKKACATCIIDNTVLKDEIA
jgi:hypothetical protein